MLRILCLMFQIANEIVRQQIHTSYKESVSEDHRRIVKRLLYGNIVKKYGICSSLRTSFVPQQKTWFQRLEIHMLSPYGSSTSITVK